MNVYECDLIDISQGERRIDYFIFLRMQVSVLLCKWKTFVICFIIHQKYIFVIYDIYLNIIYLKKPIRF